MRISYVRWALGLAAIGAGCTSDPEAGNGASGGSAENIGNQGNAAEGGQGASNNGGHGGSGNVGNGGDSASGGQGGSANNIGGDSTGGTSTCSNEGVAQISQYTAGYGFDETCDACLNPLCCGFATQCFEDAACATCIAEGCTESTSSLFDSMTTCFVDSFLYTCSRVCTF